MHKIKPILLILLIICVLFFFVYISKKSENRIIVIDYQKLNNTLKDYDYSLAVIGDISKEEEKMLLDIKNKYNIAVISLTIDDNKLSDLIKIQGFEIDGDVRYLLYAEKELEIVLEDTTTEKKLNEKLEQLINGVIPEDERYYQVLYAASDYKRRVESKKYTIAVFGYKSCTYCNLYLPVINQVAKEKKLDIFYFDRENYDADEYEKVLNLDLTIPAECTKDNIATSLKGSFAKPMTLITKSGKTVGCIRGYVEQYELESKLIEIGVIKE